MAAMPIRTVRESFGVCVFMGPFHRSDATRAVRGLTAGRPKIVTRLS
jgi:hypothetical protein